MADQPRNPVTIACPVCRQGFTVPTEVLEIDGHQVVVRMDRSEVYGHLQACAAQAGERAGQELVESRARHQRAREVGDMLDQRAYISKAGSRACTMCGTNGQDCLVTLDKRGAACCAGCHNGNTHPAPGEALGSCAEWAAGQGAQS